MLFTAEPAPNGVAAHGPTDWTTVKTTILNGLDLGAEFAALGVDFSKPGPNAKGIRECHALGRKDDVPSAFVNVRTGVYHDSGGEGLTLNLWDFALRFGQFGRWIDVIKHYAAKAGVEIGQVKAGKGGRVREAQYLYRDAAGAVRYCVFRYRLPTGLKSFSQHPPDGRGGWVYGAGCMDGIGPLPYRLPELLASDPDDPVWCVEGEKDADRLASLGLVATTSHGGAGNTDRTWPKLVEYFRGRECYILPDNDVQGRAHAAKVAAYLLPVARLVKVVTLPGLAVKGDVCNWLDLGHDLDELGRLAHAAPVWTGVDAVPPGTVGPAAEVPDPRFRLTDLGNGERLAHHHGLDLRYAHQWSKWFVWDGRRWALDNTAAAAQRAKEAARRIYGEAADTLDDNQRKQIAAWARTTENKTRLEAMLWCAAREPGIPVLHDQLDLHPWLLNCPNGTIDLETGVLHPHDRAHLITRLCPVEYDPSAECPLWLGTLDRIFDGNQTLIGFWRRLMGLSLTGSVAEQILPIPHGAGANGKSTLLGVMLRLLGRDYAMKAPPELLMAKRTPEHPTEQAALFGMRLVVAIETGEGARLNEMVIKELTGGDQITARRMREDFWSFWPSHKVFLCTNHKPVVRGTDHAIWRRLKLIPFTVTIPTDEQDRTLPERLDRELSGILAWCVRGCLEWQKDGLEPPAEVEAATTRYKQEEDLLGKFLDENCVVGAMFRAKASELLGRYKEWSGEEWMSQRRFGQAMTERGFVRVESHGIWYQGLELRQDDTAGF